MAVDAIGAVFMDTRDIVGKIHNQRTNDPVNAHLRSVVYINKHVLIL